MVLERHDWPLMEIMEESPAGVADLGAEDQFRAWLNMWEPHAVVWVGDVYSSGKPEHATHFRTIGEWQEIGPVRR